MLQDTFAHPKEPAGRGIMSIHDDPVSWTIPLADRCDAAGCGKFATELRRAAPDLSTFLLYPGMPTTSNRPSGGEAQGGHPPQGARPAGDPGRHGDVRHAADLPGHLADEGLNVVDRLRGTPSAA